MQTLKTLTQLQSDRRMDNFNRIIFGFLLGSVWTIMMYYFLVKLGYGGFVL